VRRALAVGVAIVLGLVAGVLGTLAMRAPAPQPAGPVVPLPAAISTGIEDPTTFLAWIPRGVPEGFARDVRALPETGRVTVVSEEIVWLTRSWSSAGELVDRPPTPFRIPIDAAAVDPKRFAPFLPLPDRTVMAAVANGQGILGATSAGLRGLGPGAVLEVAGERIRIAAVLPDELVGAAELVVSLPMGRRIGIRNDRYLLIQTAEDQALTADRLKGFLRPLLPVTLGVNRAIQVRAPGDTPFFRAGDSVLPPVLVKALFGEFSARPRPGSPGELIVEPAWALDHMITTGLPLIGRVTCHRGIVDQLAASMRELEADGLGDLVRSYHGCFVPRFVGRDPANMLSYHSWGIAFDLNLAGNFRGVEPSQDPRLVAALEDAGFLWGGIWVVPDGNHFEYRRTPEP